MRKYKILKNSISGNDNYCEGRPLISANTYLLGVQMSVAKTCINFSHFGSSVLDEILAFDLAEVASATFGQINMTTVSSFCGPKGLIWGYDICYVEKINHPWQIRVKDNFIPVFDINNLCAALKKLFGTVDLPRFPLFPGSHVPCAVKYITAKGKGIIYAAEGIGISYNRDKHACILMEDVGKIPLSVINKGEYKRMILENLARSLVAIGRNQRVVLKEIFVGMKDIYVGENEIGCAMTIAPYFSIAKNAIPQNYNLFDLKLNGWENIIKGNFLYQHGNY